MSPEEQKLFSHTRGGLQQKFPGFAVTDPARGIITPRFYHVYPVWIAVFRGLFGPRGGLYVNPVFALLAVVAFYHAGRSLFGCRAGLLAAGLLTASAVQIWYARFSTSEILTQFFVWSGVYLLARYEERGERFFGVAAALALGAALLSAATAIVILPAVLLYFFHRSWAARQRADAWFLVPFGLSLVHLVLQTAVFTREYVYNIYHYHYKYAPHRNRMIAGFAVGLVVLVIARLGSRRLFPLWTRACRNPYVRGGAAAALAGLIVYGYFLRPHVMPGNNNAANLKELALFLTRPALWIATAGAVLLFWRGFERRKAFFVMVALAAAVVFLRNKAISPVYPWALRRYVPVILPSFLLLASYAVTELAKWKGLAGKAAGAAACAVLFVLPVVRGLPLIKQVDHRGMYGLTSRLAGQMDSDGVYVCDGYWLATPLHFLHGKNTLSVSDKNIPKCREVFRLMERWLEEGREVFYVTHGQRPFVPRLDFVEAGTASYRSSRLQHEKRGRPYRVKELDLEVSVYRLEPIAEETSEERVEHVVDIGENYFGLVRGFDHPKRFGGGIHGRWTHSVAEVVLPWPGGDRDVALAVMMGGRRPREESLARVSLYIDGTRIAELDVDNEMKQYLFEVPAGASDRKLLRRAVLKVESTTWNPNEYGFSGYSSSSGVLMDWIKVGF